MDTNTLDADALFRVQALVDTTFAQLKHALADFDEPPSRKNLELLVAACRGKPTKYDRKPLHGKTTALFVALLDYDLIRVCSDADEPLEEIGYFHEIGHPLFRHVPRISLPITYQEFLDLPEEMLTRIYHRYALSRASVFSHPDELACELLATKLRQYFHENRPKKMTRSAKRLYRGDK